LTSQRVLQTIRLLAAALAAYFLLAYLLVAFSRIAYPFELNIIEGGMLLQVKQLLGGQALYVEPSFNFIPFIYTPLFTWVSSWSAALLGSGFENIRLVSIVCALLTAIAVGLIVFSLLNNRLSAGIAAGLYFGLAALVEFSLDQGRVDSMLACFLAWGVLIATRPEGTASMILSGILFSAAFLTKQIALIPIAFTFVALNPKMNKRAWLFAITTVSICAVSTLVLNIHSNGWFWFYCFELPAQHDIQVLHYWRFLLVDLLYKLPVACLLLASLTFGSMFKLAATNRHFLLWIVSGLILAAWLSRLHAGGSENVLLPAYIGLIICSVVAADSFKSPRLRCVAWVGLLIQTLPLLYSPSSQIPTQSDVTAGYALVSQIRNSSGPVMILSHPYLLSFAEKPLHAHVWAIHDVLRSNTSQADKLNQEIKSKISAQSFSDIIVNDARYKQEIERYYTKITQQPLYQESKAFFGLGPSVPQDIYAIK
jgi:hypothetical protein